MAPYRFWAAVAFAIKLGQTQAEPMEGHVSYDDYGDLYDSDFFDDDFYRHDHDNFDLDRDQQYGDYWVQGDQDGQTVYICIENLAPPGVTCPPASTVTVTRIQSPTQGPVTSSQSASSSPSSASASSSSASSSSASSSSASSSSASSSSASSSSASPTSPSSTSASSTSASSTTTGPTCVPTTTAVPSICPTVLPTACLDLALTNGLLLVPLTATCGLALGSLNIGSTAACLVSSAITLTTQGTDIVTCLQGTLQDRCVTSLPDACLQLQGVVGGTLTADVATCIAALGPLALIGDATQCQTNGLDSGDAVIICLQEALGIPNGLDPLGNLCLLLGLSV